MSNEYVMQRQRFLLSVFLTTLSIGTASAGPLSLTPDVQRTGRPVARAAAPAPETNQLYERQAAEAPRVRQAAAQGQYGGGFIEFLFGGGNSQRQRSEEPAVYFGSQPVNRDYGPGVVEQNGRAVVDPRYMRQEVAYSGSEAPGTVVINTNERMLYLVQSNGRAIRYGIGVGRPGFTWAGTHTITNKREWPDWTPPEEMLRRRPDLPRHMEGGPDNPLGARAMYLGSTLYRIHGSNEPWTIGTQVSSGCIRMRNEDVVDLYNRVKIGTKVVVN
jgi:lipoprotein-anchoring transpeptidase ErfK/SrfK